MDLSDDIAYSCMISRMPWSTGTSTCGRWGARVDHDELVDAMFAWIGGEFDHDTLIVAFDRLDNLEYWLDTWDGSRRDLAG